MSSLARQVKRDHPPGTCRARGAEGLCRACAAAFLGGSTTWFDEGPRREMQSVKSGGKRTWRLDDLRAWQRDHLEPAECPATPKARDLGFGETPQSSGPAPRSRDDAGQNRRRLQKLAEIERSLRDKPQPSTSPHANGGELVQFRQRSST